MNKYLNWKTPILSVHYKISEEGFIVQCLKCRHSRQGETAPRLCNEHLTSCHSMIRVMSHVT